MVKGVKQIGFFCEQPPNHVPIPRVVIDFLVRQINVLGKHTLAYDVARYVRVKVRRAAT